LDDLTQLLPMIGAGLSATGAGLAYICKRIEAHMEQAAAEERQERNEFRTFLIGREERSMQQLDAALAAQADIRDAIREHTAAITRLTGQGETQTRRLEDLNSSATKGFEELKTLLQGRAQK
jgi:hypothetical protein